MEKFYIRKSFYRAVAVLFSILFFACEEEAIPIPLPPPPPTLQATEAPEAPPTMNIALTAEEPPEAKMPEKSTAAPAPARNTEDTFYDDSEQLKSGRYAIQIAIFPNEASARALVKKMSGNGIRAYYAPVDNPAQLYGTYYRVRVGYFNRKSDAETFAKSKLEPLGYAWWVDGRRNDKIGNPNESISRPVEDPELEAAKQAYREIAKEANKKK